jgi:hypothetical protein
MFDNHFIISFLGLVMSVSAYENFYQSLLDTGRRSHNSMDDGDIDITSGTQFNGLTTFANLPYVNCFVDDEANKQLYDIAILGAPFDTVSILSYFALISVHSITTVK